MKTLRQKYWLKLGIRSVRDWICCCSNIKYCFDLGNRTQTNWDKRKHLLAWRWCICKRCGVTWDRDFARNLFFSGFHEIFWRNFVFYLVERLFCLLSRDAGPSLVFIVFCTSTTMLVRVYECNECVGIRHQAKWVCDDKIKRCSFIFFLSSIQRFFFYFDSLFLPFSYIFGSHCWKQR